MPPTRQIRGLSFGAGAGTTAAPVPIAKDAFRPTRFAKHQEVDDFFGRTKAQQRQLRIKTRDESGALWFDSIERDEHRGLLSPTDSVDRSRRSSLGCPQYTEARRGMLEDGASIGEPRSVEALGFTDLANMTPQMILSPNLMFNMSTLELESASYFDRIASSRRGSLTASISAGAGSPGIRPPNSTDGSHKRRSSVGDLSRYNKRSPGAYRAARRSSAATRRTRPRRSYSESVKGVTVTNKLPPRLPTSEQDVNMAAVNLTVGAKVAAHVAAAMVTETEMAPPSEQIHMPAFLPLPRRRPSAHALDEAFGADKASQVVSSLPSSLPSSFLKLSARLKPSRSDSHISAMVSVPAEEQEVLMQPTEPATSSFFAGQHAEEASAFSQYAYLKRSSGTRHNAPVATEAIPAFTFHNPFAGSEVPQTARNVHLEGLFADLEQPAALSPAPVTVSTSAAGTPGRRKPNHLPLRLPLQTQSLRSAVSRSPVARRAKAAIEAGLLSSHYYTNPSRCEVFGMVAIDSDHSIGAGDVAANERHHRFASDNDITDLEDDTSDNAIIILPPPPPRSASSAPTSGSASSVQSVRLFEHGGHHAAVLSRPKVKVSFQQSTAVSKTASCNNTAPTPAAGGTSSKAVAILGINDANRNLLAPVGLPTSASLYENLHIPCASILLGSDDEADDDNCRGGGNAEHESDGEKDTNAADDAGEQDRGAERRVALATRATIHKAARARSMSVLAGKKAMQKLFGRTMRT